MIYDFVAELHSFTKDDKVYIIKANKHGNLSCDCPAFKYHKDYNGRCKHIRFLYDAGYHDGMTGRFIIVVDNMGIKQHHYCTSYPDKCDKCNARFLCFTSKMPEVNEQLVREIP